jgi:hypothetical protein
MTQSYHGFTLGALIRTKKRLTLQKPKHRRRMIETDLRSAELMDSITDRREHELQRSRRVVSLRLLPEQYRALAADAATEARRRRH